MATRMVRYDVYCEKCKYADTPEVEDPCDECLCYPGQEDSRQPLMYKEKDE